MLVVSPRQRRRPAAGRGCSSGEWAARATRLLRKRPEHSGPHQLGRAGGSRSFRSAAPAPTRAPTSRCQAHRAAPRSRASCRRRACPSRRSPRPRAGGRDARAALFRRSPGRDAQLFVVGLLDLKPKVGDALDHGVPGEPVQPKTFQDSVDGMLRPGASAALGPRGVSRGCPRWRGASPGVRSPTSGSMAWRSTW